MATQTTGGGSTTSFTKTPQAVDDTYTSNEDQLIASGFLSGNIITLNVMANDLAANAKTLFSIDNGNIQVDISHSLSLLGATSVDALSASDQIHEDFVYAIRLANGTLSQARVTVDIQGLNDAATIAASANEDTTVVEAGGVANGTL